MTWNSRIFTCNLAQRSICWNVWTAGNPDRTWASTKRPKKPEAKLPAETLRSSKLGTGSHPFSNNTHLISWWISWIFHLDMLIFPNCQQQDSPPNPQGRNSNQARKDTCFVHPIAASDSSIGSSPVDSVASSPSLQFCWRLTWLCWGYFVWPYLISKSIWERWPLIRAFRGLRCSKVVLPNALPGAAELHVSALVLLPSELRLEWIDESYR